MLLNISCYPFSDHSNKANKPRGGYDKLCDPPFSRKAYVARSP